MNTNILKKTIVLFIISALSFGFKKDMKNADFSGTWERDTEKCDAGSMSVNTIPAKVEIKQSENQVEVTWTQKYGSGDVNTYTEKLSLDGSLCGVVVKPGINKQS